MGLTANTGAGRRARRARSAAALGMACWLLAPLADAQQYPPQQYPPQQYPPQQYPPQQYPPQQYPPQQYPPQQYPPQQYPPQQYPPQQYGYGQSPAAPRGKPRSTDLEIGTLYAAAIGYGVGLGVWFDAEAGIDEPGIALIPPAILGVAAPIGVYFLDDPEMPRGMPATIAAGMAIGAGEGIGIASYQFVTADDADAWGFRGLTRSVSLGATLGAVGGYALAYYEEPPPETALFVSSGSAWGAAIGSMFGYGASDAEQDYGQTNDQASLGGLIGYNVGLAATAGLSTTYLPTWDSLAWMWAGAGIGALASTPIFLFYIGDSTPPAKRGLMFMGTATTLGLIGGAVFSSSPSDFGQSDQRATHFAGNGRDALSGVQVDYVGPMAVPGGAGFEVSGRLF